MSMTGIERIAAVVLTPMVVLAACGSPEPRPVAPATPAVVAPSPAPTASAEAVAKPKPSTVDLVEGKLTPPPARIPKLQLDGPSNDQVIPSANAETFKLRLRVSNWDAMPEGSYIQYILDGVPYKPVTDPKEQPLLKSLAEGDKALAEGEHVLAIYVARKNHELVKHADALLVRRFFVRKKTAGGWRYSDDPLMVLGPPQGTFEGVAAQQITVDFFVLNTSLGEKGNSISMTLTGPGLDEEGKRRYVTSWVPYMVWAPSDGEYTLTLELVDAKGELVKSPWNPTVRKFTVKGATAL